MFKGIGKGGIGLVRITNEEELKAWLEKQDRRTCCAIAARASLRSLPVATAAFDVPDTGLQRQELTFSSFRATLISSAASTAPLPIMKALEKAATSAAEAADRAAFGMALLTKAYPEARSAAYSAAYSADSVAFPATYANARSTERSFARSTAFPPEFHLVRSGSHSCARSATYSFAFSSDAIARSHALATHPTNYFDFFKDAQVSEEFGRVAVFEAELFDEANISKHTLPMWIAFRDRPDPQGHWDFWKRWYQGMLDGKPLDWELQRAVALIDPEIWDQGVGAVAKKIREIEEDMAGGEVYNWEPPDITPKVVNIDRLVLEAENLVAETPLVEDVFYNEETARVARVVVPAIKPKTLENLLQTIEDDLEEALRCNYLNETVYEVRALRKTITKYKDNPERIEMDVVKVASLLQRQMGSVFPEDASEILGLIGTLIETQQEIHARHPEIKENRAMRALEAVREADAEEIKSLQDSVDVIHEVFEDEFADEIIEDIEEIIEGPGLDDDPDNTTGAVARTGSRLAKAWLLLKKTVAGTGIGTAAIVSIDAALPILQSLWQLMRNLLGL